MLNRIKTNQSKVRGFTLVEIIVVVFVITIGLLAVFNIIQNITIFSRLAASRLTAVYLAQEGIELVRNQRDTNWLERLDGGAAGWLDNIPPTIPPLECEKSDILDKFDRTCTTVYDPGPPEKIEISVVVSWQERGRDYSVSNATELHNWIE